MAQRPRTRWVLLALIGAVLAGALYVTFREQPVSVDLGRVDRGPMALEIVSDARTRVANPYVVAAPVSGRLHRVTLVAGDPVIGGKTIVAQISPSLPAVLDDRSRAQAQAGVAEALAALTAAEAERDAAEAARALAQTGYQRNQRLLASGTVSRAAVDNAKAQADAAEARLHTAEAAISMREAALASAQSVLRVADGTDTENGVEPVPVLAPATGTVLQVLAQSATPIATGTPIMEIGDVTGDLEIVSDVLSRDAVRVTPGDRVRITDWGGTEDLQARVIRVDPMAVTKVSALGVEEQRVNVVIRFTGNGAPPARLGHGFQVDAHIVVWESADALRVPSAALFRGPEGWSVFTVGPDGRAARHDVTVGVNNGTFAEITAGLEEGAQVVLYPTAALTDGALVTARQGAV